MADAPSRRSGPVPEPRVSGAPAPSAWPAELHPNSADSYSQQGDPWSPHERYPYVPSPNALSHGRRPAEGQAFPLGVGVQSSEPAESNGGGGEPTWQDSAVPRRRASGRLWAIAGGGVVAVVVAAVVLTQVVTDRFTEASSMGAGARSSPTGSTSRTVTSAAASLSKGPVRTSVGELLVVESDFPRRSGYSYQVVDPSGGVPPAGEDGRLGECDRLVWPAKEFPGIVQGRASYSSTPDSGYFATRIYMRELPGWGREFNATLAGCRSLTTTDGGNRSEITHTPLTLTGSSGELHGYRAVTVENPRSGSATTSERHYLLGVVRGVSFAVAAGPGDGNAYPDSLDQGLVTLYENQLRRILDAP